MFSELKELKVNSGKKKAMKSSADDLAHLGFMKSERANITNKSIWREDLLKSVGERCRGIELKENWNNPLRVGCDGANGR